MIALRTNGSETLKKVMIVDDHAVVRRGLRAMIDGASGWEICAEAENGSEAVKLAAETRPDVIVMDLTMPGLGGIDATMQIRKKSPQIEVLILTMHESDRLAGQALRAGARGYLLKGESEDKLIDALEALSRHQPYFSPSVSETLLQGYLRSEPKDENLRPLTPRERQIVKLIAEGRSNKVMASMLNVSIKTVETHRAAAMEKIGAKSAADLTLYAARNNLVEL